jgi:hypothetical protein
MKKVIATLITGVFAASVFAASPAVTPAPTAAAPADVKSAVAEKKHKASKVAKEKMSTEAKAPAAAVK